MWRCSQVASMTANFTKYQKTENFPRRLPFLLLAANQNTKWKMSKTNDIHCQIEKTKTTRFDRWGRGAVVLPSHPLLESARKRRFKVDTWDFTAGRRRSIYGQAAIGRSVFVGGKRNPCPIFGEGLKIRHFFDFCQFFGGRVNAEKGEHLWIRN